MFCKHCGKNIYDLEKCPFCADEEKTSGADDKKGKKQFNSGKGKITSALENDKKSKKKKGGNDSKKAQSFFDRLCKENKFFNFLNSFNKFIFLILMSLLGLSFLLVWSHNKGSKLEMILTFGFINAYPYMVGTMTLGIAISLVMMIIFIVQMKKKNPSNKSLFSAICENGKCDPDGGLTDISNVTWQGITYKYDKAAFVLSIIQMVIKILDTLVFMPIIVGILSKSSITDYGTLGVFLRENFSQWEIKKWICLISAILILFLSDFIIGIVRKSKHKKIAKRYQTNGLK